MKTNRFSFVAACALAAVASCSKSNEQTVQQYPWVEDETLPVPVQVMGGNYELSTKAEINNMTNVEFGVYALGESDKPQVVLFQDAYDDNCNCVPSYIDRNGMATLNVRTWNESTETYSIGPAYYPLNSTNNYSFYGFHTQDTYDVHTNIDENGTADIPEYGVVDVLWGKSVAEVVDGQHGFCAKYVRYIYSQGIQNEYLPKINFEHTTSAFVFEVYAADQRAENSFSASRGNVRVTKATVRNIPASARLIVVGEGEGTIVREGDFVERDCALPTGGVRPTLTGKEIAEFFLIPENFDDIEFDFTVSQNAIANENSTYTVKGSAIREKFESNPEFTKFEIGKRYVLKLTLQSVEKIEISVSVESWNDGFSDSILEIE